jgi:hypothetical protein
MAATTLSSDDQKMLADLNITIPKNSIMFKIGKDNEQKLTFKNSADITLTSDKIFSGGAPSSLLPGGSSKKSTRRKRSNRKRKQGTKSKRARRNRSSRNK